VKGWHLWLCAVTCYLLALAWMAPATLLDGVLDARTAGHLRLATAQGTVWSGRGSIEIRTAANAAVLTRDLRWQLDAGQLPFMRLAWRLAFAADAQPSVLTATSSRIAISQLDLALPAAALSHVVPALAGYGLGGQLQLHVDTLAFGADAMEGSATLQWHGASTTLAPVSPLGSYALQLQGAGADIGVGLQTLQGPLLLEGTGTLMDGRYPVFTAIARVSATEAESLAPFLRLFAVENPDGSFALQVDRAHVN
jgi:general secretion pathway protein N